jgi:hypothetical protein
MASEPPQHNKDLVHALGGQIDDALRYTVAGFAGKGTAVDEAELLRLLVHGVDDFRNSVPDVDHGDAGRAVKILLAGAVIHVHPFGMIRAGIGFFKN